MGKWGSSLAAGLMVAAVAVAAYYWWHHIREPDIPTGPLAEALIAAHPQEGEDVGAIFGHFIPESLSLDRRRDVLVRNGFSCALAPSRLVEGNHHLSCFLPFEGSGYCQGVRYYSYETRDGAFLDTSGAGFRARPDTLFGQCSRNREEYLSQRPAD